MQRLNRLLNVTNSEWPRILVAWSINFLLRFGFILGWTIIIASYLNNIGIRYLPLLFLGNATLVMIGTIIFRSIIHKIRREILIAFSVLVAGILLITSLFFIQNNYPIHIGLLLICEAMLVSQIYILVSLFYEDLFTPLESQRTFPIIESAEIFGTLAGGITLSIYATSIAPYKFIAIWAISLILILPIILLFNSKTMDIPKLQTEDEKLEKLHKANLSKNFEEIKKVPFLKGLMWIVFINWGIMNLIEFQYTAAIQEQVMLSKHSTGIDFEGDISQKLGTLHIIFSSGALIIQLIAASRILSGLGIVSSMLLHPIVTFFNGIIIALRYGFITSSITRGTFELTNLIFNNAYNSSYYALPHNIRDDAKELIQGIIKPIGAMAATMFILFIVTSFETNISAYILNMAIVFLSLTMAVLTSDLGKKYTEMTEMNLSHKLDMHTRLNAVEILGQNGHAKFPISLQKILRRKTEPGILKEKILNTIGRRQDTESLSSVIDMLSNQDDAVRGAAIKTIMEFHNLEKKIFDQSFTRFYTVENLKKAIEIEKNEYLQEEMVKALYYINPDETTKYLIDSIKINSKKRAGFIKIMNLFKDPNLIFFLEPYLKEKSPEIKGACIIALWQFKKIRPTLIHHLHQLLNSKNQESIIAGIEVCGLVKHSKPEILKFLNIANLEISNEALLALARLEHDKIINRLVRKICDTNDPWHSNKTHILQSLPKKFREKVNASLNLYIIHLINKLLKEHKNEILEQMDRGKLEKLLNLYRQIDAHHECYKIEKILIKTTESKIQEEI